jgi:hypothetical protein
MKKPTRMDEGWVGMAGAVADPGLVMEGGAGWVGCRSEFAGAFALAADRLPTHVRWQRPAGSMQPSEAHGEIENRGGGVYAIEGQQFAPTRTEHLWWRGERIGGRVWAKPLAEVSLGEGI